MSKFAKIENNIVSNVIVIPDEFDNMASEYLASIGHLGQWVPTPTENGSEAAIGSSYHPESKMFIAPQPSSLHILVGSNWIIPEEYFDNDAPPAPKPR